MNKVFNAIQTHKDAPRHLYAWLLNLAGYIVGTTSDQAADIAARSLPIVAPLPNAISVYYVSQTALNFNPQQALAFACAIEIAMFAVIEVALIMFDGMLKNERKYRGAFRISIAVSIVVLFIVVGFVIFVEVAHAAGHPILAALPFLSAASAVMLALKRWHARNEQQDEQTEGRQQATEHEQQLSTLAQQIEQLTAQLTEQIARNDEQAEVNSRLHDQIEQYQSKISDLNSDLQAQRVQNAGLSGRLEVLKLPATIEHSTAQIVYKNGDILHGLEDLSRDEQIVGIAQRQMESVGKVNKSKIADLAGCARGTVQKVLEDAGF